MPGTIRITITLPSEQAAALKEITDNVSGYMAEAVARQIRHRLLVDELERHQNEFGAFTQEELAEARAKLSGATDAAAGRSRVSGRIETVVVDCAGLSTRIAHDRKVAVLRQPRPVARLTSDINDMSRPCGNRVQMIAL